MFTLTEILKPLFQIVLFFYGCTIPSNGNILDILTIILDTFPQNSTFGIYKKVFTPIIDPNGGSLQNIEARKCQNEKGSPNK